MIKSVVRSWINATSRVQQIAEQQRDQANEIASAFRGFAKDVSESNREISMHLREERRDQENERS